MFSPDQWIASTGVSFYNSVATQSLRFDDGSSAHLAFTPSSASSATDRRKVTHSVWVKRGVLGADQTIYSGNRSGGGDYYLLRFSSDNKLTLVLDVDANNFAYDTSAVYRDVGAWYHVCVIIDTTQATDTDRVKIYVNGVLQDKTIKYTNHVSQNFSTYVMDGNEDEIGRFAFTDASYFDGYMAEFITTIGQNNTISEFGELKNGVWIPIDYAGSYGGNGFRLQFNQTGTGTASSSTIGADTSGNANHFTSSGIVASDCDMPDSPENNFATLNPLVVSYGSGYLLSEGNLNITGVSDSTFRQSHSTITVNSSKWYFEVIPDFSTTKNNSFGIVDLDVVSGVSYDGSWYDNSGWYGANFNTGSNIVYYQNGSSSSESLSASNGDVFGVAYDADANTMNFYHNNSLIETFTGISTGVKAFFIDVQGTGAPTIKVNFGQDSSFAGTKTAQGNKDANSIGDFYYSPPSGYLALCTANLPEPTISPNADTQADDYFSPTLYTSDNIGAGGTQSVTGVGFQPDWVWIKNRSSSGTSHTLFDSVRTAGKMLQSDNSSAEASNSQYGYLSSFDSDGFTLTGGTTNANFINQGTDAYVSWNWKAGGTAVSNTDGTITSSVSANTDAGFSIVTATSPSSGTWSVGHGLSKKPDMIIQKYRASNSRWTVWHNILTSGQYLGLNETNGIASSGTPFNFNITDSVIGGNADYDATSTTAVYYVFHNVEGYSKFDSYIGNGVTSGDGTFVFLGLRPAWIMIKNISASADWVIVDSVRSTFNEVDDILAPDNSGSESDFGTTNRNIDFLSNGFKIRSTSAGGTTALNTSGSTYIYMAFGETFKYANAR